MGDALTIANAVGRFVRIPPSVWPEYNKGGCGWVGKIIKMPSKKTVTIQMHDSQQHFTFADTLANFVPLSE